MYECNFIYDHKKNTAFPELDFTGLT